MRLLSFLLFSLTILSCNSTKKTVGKKLLQGNWKNTDLSISSFDLTIENKLLGIIWKSRTVNDNLPYNYEINRNKIILTSGKQLNKIRIIKLSENLLICKRNGKRYKFFRKQIPR